ncbi:MAG: 16S rRNA (cytidine(1402)-2'-O)-methyltransferase [Moraxellaceae bacterium]|nr:16S rRNA (cytidine(1402)-2'-O)-methyltransferase [Moraxellaceae bacterium]
MTGILYVVATPIGNLDDISARAIQVLGRVARIAAEDTRHSARLLQHLGINTHLVAVHDHNEAGKTQHLISQLLAGDDLALISDAGTPLISDPGYRLVAAAHEAKIQVVPVVGACAAIAALSAAGLPSDRFSFEGFLSAKTTARQVQLQALVHETRTLIFYEAPHRILECVQDMRAIFGEQRRVVLARELTKTFETIKQMTLAELCDFVEADTNQQRGEIVLVVEGAPADSALAAQQEVDNLLLKLLKYLPVKASAQLAAELTGHKKNALYDRALVLQQGEKRKPVHRSY